MNIALSDYGPNEQFSCSGSTYDSSANYIVAGRDYFVGTPKAGYAKYTYPHPLHASAAGLPAAPTNVRIIR